jgi:hypothetical protein
VWSNFRRELVSSTQAAEAEQSEKALFCCFRLTPNFIDESIASTNAYFGGLHPSVYRVFCELNQFKFIQLFNCFCINSVTHGEMDPQRSLGPNEDLNVNSPVKVMTCKLNHLVEPNLEKTT